MDYEQKYKELVGKVERAYLFAQTDSTKAVLEDIYPELAEVENKKIKRCIGDVVRKYGSEFTSGTVTKEKMFAWLEKQGEKTNPYSGTFFNYNGHTWGMYARDNGVDILLDKQFFTHLEKQSEQKKPCEDCSNPKLNCSNFPCVEKESI